MAKVNTRHELFRPVEDIFHNYVNPRDGGRRYSSLVIQTFIFHEGKVLLVQSTGASGWTAPSRTIRSTTNEVRACPGLIMQMLNNAIRTLTLDHIQFMDLALSNLDIVETSATEIHIGVLLSVHEACGTDRLAYLPGNNQKLQWAPVAAAAQLPLEESLPRGRLRAALDRYAAVTEAFTEFRRGRGAGQLYSFAFNTCKLAREIKTAWYGGAGVDHVLVGVKEEAEAVEGLFFIWKIEKVHSDKYYDGGYTKVVIPLGYDGGRYPMEKMDLVGEFQANGGVLDELVNLKVMLEDEEPRLKTGWRKHDRTVYFQGDD